MNIILKAAQFAAKAHAGQKRQYTGTDYVEHPARVAGLVATYSHEGITEEVVAAAFLHDVLEDCPQVNEATLLAEFGPVVTRIVVTLTHLPKTAGNRATRQRLYREQLKEASHAARVIKLFDRLDNLREMDGADPGFKALYARESVELVDGIGYASLTLAVEIRKLAAMRRNEAEQGE